MNELCECMDHDGFDNMFIGSDNHFHCSFCKGLISGWDDVAVGTLEDEPEVPVRCAQKAYFKTRKNDYLQYSKQAEAEVDKALREHDEGQ